MVDTVKLYQIRKLALASIFVFSAGQLANAGSTSQINVGLTITGKKEIRQPRQARYTCNAAKSKVRLDGYSNVQTKNCNGDTYLFVGQDDAGTRDISVNAFTGEVSAI